MDAAELSQARFWDETGAELVVLGNPRRRNDLASVKAAAGAIPEIAGHVIVETSGSSGQAKFVCLSRTALLASARAVNRHLRVTTDDVWLCALPTFHVGGLGIYARGFCAANSVIAYAEEWQPAGFSKSLQSAAITLTALVPTQIADLVAAEVSAPASLRAVIVGGGHLDRTIEKCARQLGWPLLLSYGMTETCSQIATQPLEQLRSSEAGNGLQVLPHCQVRNDRDQRLAVRGDSLLTAYLIIDEAGHAKLNKPLDDDNWFVTQDRVAIDGDQLTYLGRVDRQVKILGELVDLDRVEAALRKGLDPGVRESVTVEAIADRRRGFRLIPIIEKRVAGSAIDAGILTFNQQALPFERLEAWIEVDRFPRSPLGKLQRSALCRLARLR